MTPNDFTGAYVYTDPVPGRLAMQLPAVWHSLTLHRRPHTSAMNVCKSNDLFERDILSLDMTLVLSFYFAPVARSGCLLGHHSGAISAPTRIVACKYPCRFLKITFFLNPSRAIFFGFCRLSTNEPRFYTM